MKNLLTLILLIAVQGVVAQVGIGTTTPAPGAQLEISATDKGILIPRITRDDRPGNPGKPEATEGLMIYQTDHDPGFYYYDGSEWVNVGRKPSTSYAIIPLPKGIPGNPTPQAIPFESPNLSDDVTFDEEEKRFTIQKGGLYQISYTIVVYDTPLFLSILTTPDEQLAARLLPSIDFSTPDGSVQSVVKGQVTTHLDPHETFRLEVTSPSDFNLLLASISITRL